MALKQVSLHQEEDVAVEITDITTNSLTKYYDTLSILGYSKQSNVEKLLVLSFIEEMLAGDMGILVNESDYKIINKAIQCLYGDCLIPYQQYQGSNMFGIFNNGNPINPRITENSNIRFTEDDAMRFRSGV